LHSIFRSGKKLPLRFGFWLGSATTIIRWRDL
jgi:hypothetical protein